LRILIADDHDMVLETIAAFLKNEIEAEFETAADLPGALDLIERTGRFDLVLLDYSMPGMNGLKGLAKALEANGGKGVAILSGNVSNKIAHEAIDAGAIGFLPKTLKAATMVHALGFMLSGEKFFPLSVLQEEDDSNGHPLTKDLTQRETEVLAGLCKGLSNKEIANNLDLQEVTIKLHVRTLCRKLEVKNRTQAALAAKEAGLF
jgi:DNA-binding NarL/FixJ family response regulator